MKERKDIVKALESLQSMAGISLKEFTLKALLSAAAVFVICFIAITVILKIIDHIHKRSKLDNTVKSFVRSAIKTGLWIIAAIMVATALNIPTPSLVALLSVAGLALSLSFQGILANLFSGMTILTTKPFTAGDFVEINGAAGTVTEVLLFYTTMITVDNKTIYIPNKQVADAKIINYSRQKNRRVDLTFNVDYEIPTDTVKQALADAVKSDGRILEEPAPFIGLLSYKESSIEYVIRAWAKQEDYWDVHFSLNEKVRALFNERGVEMTYNHLNVHIIDKQNEK